MASRRAFHAPCAATVARDKKVLAMSDHPLTDYEKYIRTDELLALQKRADQLSCHDELLFQTVHQVAELWMKLAEHELRGAARNG